MSNFGLLVPRAVKEINEISLYGAEKIGNYAFRDCIDLTSITIPKTVTSIGNYAFYGCTSLIDCTILKNDSVLTLSSSNFNSINNKIYVPYSLLKNYKEATNWVGISDKIMGYQTFSNGEILPRYNTTHTFTWYPSKADLIAGTNGIVANDTNITTSAGEWYCERPMLRVDLIDAEKSTSWTEPTSSTTKTENINFDRPANNSFPINLRITVTNKYNSYSKEDPRNAPVSLNYNGNREFDNTETIQTAWLKLYFNSTGYLKVENQTYYKKTTFPPSENKAWQNITIHEAYQIIN